MFDVHIQVSHKCHNPRLIPQLFSIALNLSCRVSTDPRPSPASSFAATSMSCYLLSVWKFLLAAFPCCSWNSFLGGMVQGHLFMSRLWGQTLFSLEMLTSIFLPGLLGISGARSWPSLPPSAYKPIYLELCRLFADISQAPRPPRPGKSLNSPFYQKQKQNSLLVYLFTLHIEIRPLFCQSYNILNF